jgi:hypothetical protein
MARFCGSCGTEVDETAVFCPTCGQPIDQGAEAEIPAAPAWPDPAVTDTPDRRAPGWRADGEPPRPATPAAREPEPVPEAPTRVEQRPPEPELVDRQPDRPPEHAEPEPAPGTAPERGRDRGLPEVNLPITMPVTLSAWLIGVGALLAVIGLLVVLVGSGLNVIDLLLLIALLGVAAAVFFSGSVPVVPHLRLATLVVAMITFGVALDRIGFRTGGAGELLLFLGSAAAAIGAIILELGQDQPLGGPQS